jgi:FkbM family methyltransferase
MRVLAFEPVSKTASIFEANIDANGLGGKITCIRAAISNKVGSHEIYISPGHSGVASLTMNSGVQRHREAIELICIDQVDALSSSSLPVLIKIDVEGHEGVVISELARSCHLPRIFGIFYEVDEAWSDPSELQQVLANAGFGNFKRFGVGTHYDILATK